MSAGRRMCDLAKENGISASAMHERLKRGWRPIDAATIPTRVHQRGALDEKYGVSYSAIKGHTWEGVRDNG